MIQFYQNQRINVKCVLAVISEANTNIFKAFEEVGVVSSEVGWTNNRHIPLCWLFV